MGVHLYGVSEDFLSYFKKIPPGYQRVFNIIALKTLMALILNC